VSPYIYIFRSQVEIVIVQNLPNLTSVKSPKSFNMNRWLCLCLGASLTLPLLYIASLQTLMSTSPKELTMKCPPPSVHIIEKPCINNPSSKIQAVTSQDIWRLKNEEVERRRRGGVGDGRERWGGRSGLEDGGSREEGGGGGGEIGAGGEKEKNVPSELDLRRVPRSGRPC
jgi:uncharacterized membrane protein YgcG